MGIILNWLFGKKNKSRSGVLPTTLDLIQADWQQIDILIKGGQPSQLKDALLKADKTLDNALRDIVAGDQMSDRLKNAKDKFEYSLYDKLWKAHKMRNAMVHEAGFDPIHTMVKRAIEDLRAGLRVLGVKV